MTNDVNQLPTYQEQVFGSAAFRCISDYYGSRTAQRSKVPLINHIKEGIAILDMIGADSIAAEAYCAHPLLQADPDLEANWSVISKVLDGEIILLAMEYRNIANRFLSNKVIKRQVEIGEKIVWNVKEVHPIKLSPIEQVNNMLIADKVQNRKDFEQHHKGSHARSSELDYYFRLWLTALGVTEQRYQELISKL